VLLRLRHDVDPVSSASWDLPPGNSPRRRPVTHDVRMTRTWTAATTSRIGRDAMCSDRVRGGRMCER
jgi:hypothetical protein